MYRPMAKMVLKMLLMVLEVVVKFLRPSGFKLIPAVFPSCQ